MNSIPIYALLDLDAISRWSMVNTTTRDTVASHSFRVAMIAIAIQKEINPEDIGVIKDLAYYAIFHDSEEAYSGDIATHVKVKLKNAGVDINAIFARDDGAPDYIRQIIKAADMMDAYIFIQHHGIGPRAADALTYNIIRWNEFSKNSKCEVVRKASVAVYNKIMTRGEFL